MQSSWFSRRKTRSELSQWLDRSEERGQVSREWADPSSWHRWSGEVPAIKWATRKVRKQTLSQGDLQAADMTWYLGLVIKNKRRAYFLEQSLTIVQDHSMINKLLLNILWLGLSLISELGVWLNLQMKNKWLIITRIAERSQGSYCKSKTLWMALGNGRIEFLKQILEK